MLLNKATALDYARRAYALENEVEKLQRDLRVSLVQLSQYNADNHIAETASMQGYQAIGHVQTAASGLQMVRILLAQAYKFPIGLSANTDVIKGAE